MNELTAWLINQLEIAGCPERVEFLIEIVSLDKADKAEYLTEDSLRHLREAAKKARSRLQITTPNLPGGD